MSHRCDVTPPVMSPLCRRRLECSDDYCFHSWHLPHLRPCWGEWIAPAPRFASRLVMEPPKRCSTPPVRELRCFRPILVLTTYCSKHRCPTSPAMRLGEA